MDSSCSRPAPAQSCGQREQGGAESPRKRAFQAPGASSKPSTKRRLFGGPMPGGAGQPLQPDAAVGPPAPALADAGDEGVSVKLAAVVRRVTARQLLQPAPDRAQLDRTFAAFRQEVIRDFAVRYNFDIVSEQPVEHGRWEWLRVGSG